MRQRRTSKGLVDWLTRLGLPVTNISEKDIQTKREYDEKKKINRAAKAGN